MVDQYLLGSLIASILVIMVLYNLYTKQNGRAESTTAVTTTTTTINSECRSKNGGGDEDDDVVDDLMKKKNGNVLRKIEVDECDEDLHPATRGGLIVTVICAIELNVNWFILPEQF
ncbi:hypothetical protein LOK49_LG09G02315 [Camellia lanceoleosa]|uniref:Uncharacterized protein n=1 Tax=Camellia lanceoleosa TaxID=1840588 RepID=A0ACC0GJA7_9ERIC|nr:hypothetical protein LOK49_LG09G02315 [Camellia lanceoleosa]